MEIFSLIVQGAALGITAAVSPGMFQTYLITQTLTGGWRRGLPVAFAPLLSDPLIIMLALLLLNQVPADFLRFIGIAGGLFAYYLSWGLFREWRNSSLTATTETQPSGNALIKGFAMNLLSPGPYMFWVLVNGPILLAALRQSIFLGIAFLLGFYTLFIGGMLGIVALFHQARRLGARVVHNILLVSILILILFGSLLIWQAIT